MREEGEQTAFVVDDDAAIREGLSDQLESAGINTRAFPSAEAFLADWKPEMAGCLVLDVRLPGMSGLELQAKLAEAEISPPVIIMTAYGDVPMVRKALKSGAVEFLIKPFQDEELLQTVRYAFAIDRKCRQAEAVLHPIQARAETLTSRERQVLELATAGMTNKEIADRLHLSVVTVKLHRGQGMRKMQAETFVDLVKMWERISPPDGVARTSSGRPSREA
jgi:FixJ family two-component response regulator